MIKLLQSENSIISLINSHIETLEAIGFDHDNDFVRGLLRAVEIIEYAQPKVIWKEQNDCEVGAKCTPIKSREGTTKTS